MAFLHLKVSQIIAEITRQSHKVELVRLLFFQCLLEKEEVQSLRERWAGNQTMSFNGPFLFLYKVKTSGDFV